MNWRSWNRPGPENENSPGERVAKLPGAEPGPRTTKEDVAIITEQKTIGKGPALFSGLIRPGVEWIALPADRVDTLVQARPDLATWKRLDDPDVPGVAILVRNDDAPEPMEGRP